MGWFLAALPWGTIVKEAAALLKHANDLRSVRQAPVTAAPPLDADALRDRIDQLEQQQRADAELMQHLAAELATIARAAQATEVRLRWITLLSAVAVGAAVFGAVVAWLR